MSIMYKKTADNVGYEIIDSRTRQRVHEGLVFTRSEAMVIVRRLLISRRGAPKRNKGKKNSKRKVITLRR